MKIAKFLALLCGVATLVACETTPVDDVPLPEGGSLLLSVDTNIVKLGDGVKFTVIQEGVDVTSSSDLHIYDQNMVEVSANYTPSATGGYSFFATRGAESSNRVRLTVMTVVPEAPAAPEAGELFKHRVMILDVTGNQCYPCTMMMTDLYTFAQTEWHDYYNEVTCHAGGLTRNDPANSPAADVLERYVGPDGYPYVTINFYGGRLGTNGNPQYFVQQASAALKRVVKKYEQGGANVGIAINSVAEGTSVYSRVAITAAVEAEYKVTAWLLENNIMGNQTGATEDHQKVYNHAVRNIAGEYNSSNVLGESIGVLAAGQSYDTAFELPVINNSWNVNYMDVMVIVTAKNGQGRWEVVNTAVCPAKDGSRPYEYTPVE